MFLQEKKNLPRHLTIMKDMMLKVINGQLNYLPMPTARHGLAAVAIGDKIYVIGGAPEPGLSVTNVNEIFHIDE
jgi:hypothetical protein